MLIISQKEYLFSLLFMLFFFFSCTDDLLPAATSIVNESATASAEEFLLELEINSSGNPDRDIVLDSIKNIVVAINDNRHATFHYFKENQIRVDDLILENGYLTTAENFSHKLVLDYLTTAEDFQTAGEFADFLTNFLQPGDYFFTVESFQVFDDQGVGKTIEIYEDFLLNVEEGQQSVYVGKIEIEF